MIIDSAIKQIQNIDKKLNSLFDQEKKAKIKIQTLENKMQNIYNLYSRPDAASLINDNENNAHFNEYLRKGNVSRLITKDLTSEEGAAGVVITPHLHDKIIHAINTTSPIRQIASIETISTNALDVVIEDGNFDSGWIGEVDERDVTNTPKLKKERILVHELYAQPKASQALIDDVAVNIENWLAQRITDSFVKIENEAFINGDGNNKPKGILSYADQIETIKINKTEGNYVITPEMLLNAINALDEGHLANATFLMNRITLAEIQKLRDTTGRFIWQPSLSDHMKQTIFGIPVVCASNMPIMDDDAFPIALADFNATYKIVDRSGIHIMRDQFTEKGFVKFYTLKRVGGSIINFNSIRLMQCIAS